MYYCKTCVYNVLSNDDILSPWHVFFSAYSSEANQWLRISLNTRHSSAKYGKNELHQQTADGTRKRVPFQQVSDAGTKDRDRRGAWTERNSSENLVPKPPDETEEAPPRGTVWSEQGR